MDDNTSDILQRYLLKMDNDSFTFSIIYNVRRLILISSISGVTDVQDKLKNSIIGSEHVGFDVSFKNEENQTLIYFRNFLDKNILEDNSERLFWINDISLSLRDILINLFLRS